MRASLSSTALSFAAALWTLYEKPHSSDSSAPPDGNAGVKGWRSRDGAPLYFLALVATLLVSLPCVALLQVHFLRELALLQVITIAGFVYTNYVTTARLTLFCGKYGSAQDFLIVMLLLPVAKLCVRLRALPAAAETGQEWPTAAAGPSRAILHEQCSPLPPFSPLNPLGGLAPNASWVLCVLQSFWLPEDGDYGLHVLLAVFVLGLHVPYVTRSGLLARSFSERDLASASFKGWIGVSVKLVFLLACFFFHLRWCFETGQLLLRLSLYAAVVLVLAGVSAAVRDDYYVHLHHWCCGIVLLPLTHTGSELWTAGLQGLCLSQFVEGAARWSCAPLWHPRV
jgi:hypothetical protein